MGPTGPVRLHGAGTGGSDDVLVSEAWIRSRRALVAAADARLQAAAELISAASPSSPLSWQRQAERLRQLQQPSTSRLGVRMGAAADGGPVPRPLAGEDDSPGWATSPAQHTAWTEGAVLMAGEAGHTACRRITSTPSLPDTALPRAPWGHVRGVGSTATVAAAAAAAAAAQTTMAARQHGQRFADATSRAEQALRRASKVWAVEPSDAVAAATATAAATVRRVAPPTAPTSEGGRGEAGEADGAREEAAAEAARALEQERRAREKAEGALGWLRLQLERAGMGGLLAACSPPRLGAAAAGHHTTAASPAVAPPGGAGVVGGGQPSPTFHRALVTAAEAEAAVSWAQSEAHARLRHVEGEMLSHLAAASIQTHQVHTSGQPG
jgi:hypothetical protein